MNLFAGGYLSFYMPDKRSSLVLEVTNPRSLRSVLMEVGIPLKEVQLVILNDKIVDLNETVVEDQDQVKVYSPIDGG